mmetsp:Transcript_6336/g.4773  ORF Transcript_6336/g.4773 Transcript_6336/m.4773 type:complete len:144 (-) Transcript_6336:211-642(-)
MYHTLREESSRTLNWKSILIAFVSGVAITALVSSSFASGSFLSLQSISAPSSSTTIVIGSTTANDGNLLLGKPTFAANLHSVFTSPHKVANGVKSCPSFTNNHETNELYHSGTIGAGNWVTVDMEQSTFVKRVKTYERGDTNY